jgi:hypothetical protein
MKWLKKSFFGFFIGVFLITPLDWVQTHFGIVEYHFPYFFKLAWWTPLAYGLVFLWMALFFPFLEELLTATFTFKRRTLFIEVLAIIVAFFGPVLTQEYPYLIVFILAIYVLFRLGFFHAKWDWLFFVIGALLGPTVEVLLINYDLYHFTDPNFMGIPYWLPLEWGIVAMSGRRIADVLELPRKK